MLNPQNASKSPLSSRVALPVALMLAGVFGLGISLLQPVSLQPVPISKNMTTPPAAAPAAEDSGILVSHQPEETPDELAAKADAKTPPAPEDLVGFCARHVTEKRSFVVFKRGTCVVINEPCEDPMAEARRILARCTDPGARFMTEPTTEGDVIVAFKDPVFHRFSQKELKHMESWLKQGAAALPLLTPAETVTAGEGWTPPETARIGLLARRRLLEDAASAVPVKVIRAKDRAMAAR